MNQLIRTDPLLDITFIKLYHYAIKTLYCKQCGMYDVFSLLWLLEMF